MIEDQHLKYLINEELFLIEEKEGPKYKSVQTETDTVQEPEAVKTDLVQDSTPHHLIIKTDPLNEQDRELLSNLLKAVGTTINDVKLIQDHNMEVPDFERIICFGSTSGLEPEMTEELTPNNPRTIGTRTILLASSIPSLHGNKIEKGRLWAALQRVFDLH